MKKIMVILLLALASVPASPAAPGEDFSKAIAYYLVGDMDLAKNHLDAHFRIRPQSTVKKGFALLLKNEHWEATKTFSYYLESDHRSLEALTGVSLSLADMKNSLAIENLLKIIRINAGYAPAFLCLGNEYLKRKNYPAAEANFKKSVQLAKFPEFKLLLGELYLQTGQPQKAGELIQAESDNAPANYYYALLSARAFYQLENWSEMSTYIARTLKARPDSQEGQLLLAKYQMKTGELRKARKTLEKLKFSNYNLEHGLTFAEVLLQLKDNDAEKYLYEVFSQYPWEPRVNQMLGVFHSRKSKAGVQHWVDRALLSGKKAEALKREFSGAISFPAYPFLEFFDVKKIQWLSKGRVMAAGSMLSGEKEKLVILDAQNLKIIKTFDYEGSIQDVFPADGLDKIVFSTTAVENEKVYLYTLIVTERDYVLKPVVGYALKMASVLVAFNAQASDVYVTDGNLTEQAFVSPFSTLNAYGRKTAVYPNYPFAAYRYTYATERWQEIKGREALRRVPINKIQHYLAVADAMQDNPEVAKLLEKGRDIDLTASEEVKIYFGSDAGYFIIWFSDLKNAFQGMVYNLAGNSAKRFDETMFLGEKYYSELNIISFDPDKQEILFLTKDKEKNLYMFNYHSLLYKKLGSGILAVSVNPEMDTIFFLNERNKYLYFSESNLEIVRLAPYARERISSRRDLNAIIDCSGSHARYFTTFNGELLKLDDEGVFSPVQVSLTGTVHQPSPDRKKAAAFINGRLFVLPWQR
ncbi:MAG TPA: tetratricopeptide repeat protein [Candidatus Binatia bacterium]|nr:tetratricopeptide repeat protein [Candidatus Binatia bacterium]